MTYTKPKLPNDPKECQYVGLEQHRNENVSMVHSVAIHAVGKSEQSNQLSKM